MVSAFLLKTNSKINNLATKQPLANRFSDPWFPVFHRLATVW
jgi:hypothetical protein